YYRFKYMEPGAGISLQQRLNPSFNLMEKFSFTQVKHSDKIGNAFNAEFLTLNLKLKYKFDNGYIFKEDAVVAPFFVGGIGGSYITSDKLVENKLKPNFAAGAGITFKFNDRVGLEWANIFNWPTDDNWDGLKSGEY